LYVTKLLMCLALSIPNDHDVVSPHRTPPADHHPVRVMTLPVACGVVIVGLANKENKA
jgi:hypothetical protein